MGADIFNGSTNGWILAMIAAGISIIAIVSVPALVGRIKSKIIKKLRNYWPDVL